MTRTGPPCPAYVEMAESIHHQILPGQLIPNDRLPIEPAMTAQYGVSRSTTHAALRVLASKRFGDDSRRTRWNVRDGTTPDQLSTAFETGLSFIAFAEWVHARHITGSPLIPAMASPVFHVLDQRFRHKNTGIDSETGAPASSSEVTP
ncbi:GntR family transcriptional regulator [Rhodococcus globerulus]|uniref:GntR family transcriptional regulator n=1 Tax=Rhodococcus globerulus TaxID=33008 RepID=UPI003015EBC5